MVAILVVSGCTQPTAMPDFAPFKELEGVSLGMKVRDLREVRPNAVVSGYVGYHETHGTGRIEYQFPGSYSEKQAPPARARLRGVAFVEEASSDSAAQMIWRARIRQAADALQGEPVCREFNTSFVRGLFAEIADVTVTLRYRDERPPIPAGVTTQVGGITPPRSSNGSAVAC